MLVAVVITVLIAAGLALSSNCPSAGWAFTRSARSLNRLKNRTEFPQSADYDPRITLDELLRPGEDSNRWSSNRAARIQGEVIDVKYAHPEATNCFCLWRRDLHIPIAQSKGAQKNAQVILEVTPVWRDLASEHGTDWSETTLRAKLLDHWCEFEGWLYFDEDHADRSRKYYTSQPEQLARNCVGNSSGNEDCSD